MRQYIEAYRTHRNEAEQAFRLFRSYCAPPLPRVPGMDTVIRLAWRIECGRSVEQAAAREYVYRWHLAVKPGHQVTLDSTLLSPCVSVFGAPHTLGM